MLEIFGALEFVALVDLVESVRVLRKLTLDDVALQLALVADLSPANELVESHLEELIELAVVRETLAEEFNLILEFAVGLDEHLVLGGHLLVGGVESLVHSLETVDFHFLLVEQLFELIESRGLGELAGSGRVEFPLGVVEVVLSYVLW